MEEEKKVGELTTKLRISLFYQRNPKLVIRGSRKAKGIRLLIDREIIVDNNCGPTSIVAKSYLVSSRLISLLGQKQARNQMFTG